RGFTDSLKSDLYRHLALSPIMNWKDAVPPNPPQNLRFERIAGTGTTGLRWDIPNFASDGDTASRYVVYRFDQPTIPPGALDDPSKIITVTGERLSMRYTPTTTNGSYYYAVTSLDRNANESAASMALLILPPAAPLLAAPANGAVLDTAQIAVRWFYPDNASSYRLQVALDSTFTTQLLVNESGIIDTSKVVPGLAGQQTYYWRVQASNPSGASAFSRTGIFTTGFPTAVALEAPSNNMRDIPLRPTLMWRTATGASSYHLQVGSTSLFDSASTVFNMAGIADTAYQISQLQEDRFYFWRVRASNAIGEGNWSTTWRFRTANVTAVAEATTKPPAQYQLYQNYPNPFNPITTIVFDLPQPGTPQLVIFDALGREVLTLLNAPLAAGRHTVQFDASLLPSGVYYYRLNFERRVLTRRMTVLK
ncbi:MAG: T9SS type A sorting domain-containing protein, partial [bacterium]